MSLLYPYWKQPTPRKGTETPDSPWRRQRPDGNNPHPARGRKPPRPTHGPLQTPKQPTPRKGTETSTRQGSPSTTRNNPHPARGRKLLDGTVRDAKALGNNPHPARGRKLVFQRQPTVFCETTHTPQGDGNHFFAAFRLSVSRNNPHPARGRKLSWYDTYSSDKRNNPHPARGRKQLIVPECLDCH